jgi:hypothetical protein
LSYNSFQTHVQDLDHDMRRRPAERYYVPLTLLILAVVGMAWACGSETFRPPSGTDWEQSGIVPDIEILLDWDEFTVQDDPQLQAAADWLRQAAGD